MLQHIPVKLALKLVASLLPLAVIAASINNLRWCIARRHKRGNTMNIVWAIITLIALWSL